MASNTEEKRLAIDIIATLVNIKGHMATRILDAARVPNEVYDKYLYRVNPMTGRRFTKREMAPLILDEAAKIQPNEDFVHNIIEIASNWSSFELADKEMDARAVVQKAREVLDEIERRGVEERANFEQRKQERIAKERKERIDAINSRTELLLLAFDSLVTSEDTQKRGYYLEEFLVQVCNLYEIPVTQAFRRNDRAEQIDGAITLNGWHYLIECKWRKKPSDTSDLDALLGKVNRSGKQTMGIFISINHWSSHVEPILKQNPSKAVFLVSGFDIRRTLVGQHDFRDLLLAKSAHLNLMSEPYLSIDQYIHTSYQK